MRQTIEAIKGREASAEQREASCRHHWIIDSPHSLTSKGYCTLCGEERQFQNYMGDYFWSGGPLPESDVKPFPPIPAPGPEPQTD